MGIRENTPRNGNYSVRVAHSARRRRLAEESTPLAYSSLRTCSASAPHACLYRRLPRALKGHSGRSRLAAPTPMASRRHDVAAPHSWRCADTSPGRNRDTPLSRGPYTSPFIKGKDVSLFLVAGFIVLHSILQPTK